MLGVVQKLETNKKNPSSHGAYILSVKKTVNKKSKEIGKLSKEFRDQEL